MRRCLLVFVLLAGCDGLGEFRTEPGEVFEGPVVGGVGDEQPTFIRSGFSGFTMLELTFDPANAVPADDSVESVGSLTTFVCDEDGDCDDGLFSDAQLEPIPQLSHDALGVYEMPGSSRLRNYIFGARFTSGAGLFEVQRHAMVFLSLLENGRIEVRIIAPSVLAADGESTLHEALFGVFSLERKRTQ